MEMEERNAASAGQSRESAEHSPAPAGRSPAAAAWRMAVQEAKKQERYISGQEKAGRERDRAIGQHCCITYNHGPYIRQTLEGFLMQETDFPYEILIHDDASADGTRTLSGNTLPLPGPDSAHFKGGEPVFQRGVQYQGSSISPEPGAVISPCARGTTAGRTRISWNIRWIIWTAIPTAACAFTAPDGDGGRLGHSRTDATVPGGPKGVAGGDC